MNPCSGQILTAILLAAAWIAMPSPAVADPCSIPEFAFGSDWLPDSPAIFAGTGDIGRSPCPWGTLGGSESPLLVAALGIEPISPTTRIASLLASRLPDDSDLPINPESKFLDRGRRNPWMAALASLVIPGAGQFYNSAAPHAFTLKGYDFWMYGQGGAHVLLLGASIFHQMKGLSVQYIGGNVIELSERDGQVWRIVHVINAVIASVTAWFEADLINRLGWNYIVRMRMHAWYDPIEREASVSATFAF